jgi:hypothetical protein
MRFDASRALLTYSAAITGVLIWMLLSGARAHDSSQFDTIDVHRINVREDDGTIRMIIASRDHFPGLIAHNRERPHPTRADVAGMIFLNDEGTENGGLIFGGRKVAGKVTAFGHLSFDQYEQDQVINLEQTEEAGTRYGGLTVADYPDTSMDFDLEQRLSKMSPAERDATLTKLRESGAFGQRRLFVGKSKDRDALVALRDGAGHVRLRMRVTAAGVATIEFLDAAGKVLRTDTAAGSTQPEH